MNDGATLARPAARVMALLAWYDRHRRDLPWRARPGETPDPYRVWLSEIMLQQTNVKTAAPYFLDFLDRWPNVAALAAAPLEEVLKAWAGLGYYARARNLHAAAQTVVARHAGVFPDNEAALRALPGIGAYTAGAIAAIAFNRHAAAIDGNVERVMTRLHAIEKPLPQAKAAIVAATRDMVEVTDRPGDLAQALMDLGATVCTPTSPACGICPWMDGCLARMAANPTRYPIKAAKKVSPTKRGAVFVVTRPDGAVLVRTRAAKGLLGGMTEVPGTDWTTEGPGEQPFEDAPIALDYRRTPGVVAHVFTHFRLELAVFVASTDAPAPQGMRFLAANDIAGAALPTLFVKALVHAGLDVARRPRR